MKCSKKLAILGLLLIFCIVSFSGCSNNGREIQSITSVSSSEPQIGFWVALYAEENVIQADTPFMAQIAFGTRARNLECISVTISSEDFDATSSCPNEYIVDGQKYSDEDFYVNDTSKITFNDLPQCFTISLSPKVGKEVYSGSVEIVVTEYMVGGHSSGSVVLYYHGNDALICFSPNSQKEAENIFNTQKS